jgi:TRAP-type C4-dicarboxylate transport system substrate-binding protein
MFKKKWLSVLLVTIFTLSAVAACGGNAGTAESPPAGTEDVGETYTFKVSIQGNEDEIACISTMKAMEDIEAKTGGKVTFDVFPASELGDYMQIFGEVQQGSIDIANLALSSEYSMAFDLPLLPYLASSADELKWMFTNKDSYVWNLWSDELQGFDMKLINVTGNGFMGFASTLDNLDYEALCDFTVQKNIKTRVPPMDLFVTLVTDMGLNPTSVSYSETYSALQTGVIDAWTGGNPESNYVHFRDIIKNYADLRYGYEVTATIMNSKKYDSLPDDYKAIFDEAFTAVAIDQIDQKQDIDAGFLKQLEEAGIEIYTPTEAQFEAMAEHIRRVSWPKYAEMWGEDVLTALQDDYKNMR